MIATNSTYHRSASDMILQRRRVHGGPGLGLATEQLAEAVGQTRLLTGRLRLVGPVLDLPIEQEQEQREQQRVQQRERDQRQEDLRRAELGRDRLVGAQDVPNDPGLSSDLGRPP